MLEINNLTCGYDSGFLLENINLKINKGELIGIIGPNGSGKTTLFNSITRIIEIQKGNILLNNKDINLMSFTELAQNVAVVSQNTSPGYISIRDFVLLGRIPYFNKFQFFESKKDIEIADKYMELTGIDSHREHYLNEISGGERQLAYITRAIVQEPKLLLLDEPVSHLDIAHQVSILDLIKDFNKKNELTVIVILHDLNLAAEYCDRLILMNNGRIHKADTPENILKYEIIEEVYKTVVVVKKNPVSNKPYVFIVSGNNLNRNNANR